MIYALEACSSSNFEVYIYAKQQNIFQRMYDLRTNANIF